MKKVHLPLLGVVTINANKRRALNKNIFLSIDRIWCGKYQVQAGLLHQLSDENQNPSKLAIYRTSVVTCLIAELLGYFFITLGLSSSENVYPFILGILLMISGTTLGAFFQNKSGIYLSIFIQNQLQKLKKHTLEINAFLSNQGCTEAEINSLKLLPTELYQTELISFQKLRVINIGAPLFCGLALLYNGDTLISILIIILGLSSFPIGEKFFKNSTFRKESELRIGFAAQLNSYISRIYNEHIKMTTQVNLLTQIPILLFSIKLLYSQTGHILSIFYALTQGLVGLSGTLSFQKARVSAAKTTEIATHLINAISSPYLIVTHQRWKEHCKKHIYKNYSIKQNGVLIDNFSANIPFQKNQLFSISCFIPEGTIGILKAPSGKGKTTFISAITHLIEHNGEIAFIKNHKIEQTHNLSREEFEKYIFHFKEDNIDKSSRLIDLFKSIKKPPEADVCAALTHLAWYSPDNLIAQEIQNILDDKRSVFPVDMLDFIKNMRIGLINEISHLLNDARGNLSSKHINPERLFSTLSSGEKRRISTLLALEYCKLNLKTSLIILDEPFTHLDSENIEFQIHTIKQILKLPSSPSLLLISHQDIDYKNNFEGLVQEIKI